LSGVKAELSGSGMQAGIPERSKTPKPFEEMTIEELQAEVFARAVTVVPIVLPAICTVCP